MYTTNPGMGAGSTAAGIAALPFTAGNEPLMAVALLSIAIGSAILLSTAMRFIAKKYYKAR